MAVDREQERRLHAAAIKRLERMKMRDCFDPINLDSRPVPSQQEIFDDIHKYRHRYVRSGNQYGKSTIGAREVAWIFEDNHPNWSRPKEWAHESLLILVVGRVSKQVEETLWKKIKGFLDPASYREHRSGGALQKVTNPTNGNTILFASHHSDEEAREKLQSFVAHYVWLDEMPGSVGLIEELHRRVQARNGYFLATFTPKVRNDALRKFVDAQKEPLARVYSRSMFDNPIYADRQEEILSSMSGLTEAYRNSVLYGDWLQDSNTVYQFDSSLMVVDRLPPHYSSAWRHVEAVDPALKSKFGFVLLAEDPQTTKWYVIKADYITDLYSPRDMVLEIEKRTKGYNIVRRVSDPHEPWYTLTAADMKIQPPYSVVYNKANRKGELIKNLQEALGSRLLICSWCTDLIDEFMEMRWSESQADTIVNGRSYHLNDSLQYGLDLLPPPSREIPRVTPEDFLRDQHEKYIQKRYAEEKAAREGRTAPHRRTFTLQKKSTRWRYY